MPGNGLVRHGESHEHFFNFVFLELPFPSAVPTLIIPMPTPRFRRRRHNSLEPHASAKRLAAGRIVPVHAPLVTRRGPADDLGDAALYQSRRLIRREKVDSVWAANTAVAGAGRLLIPVVDGIGGGGKVRWWSAAPEVLCNLCG